MFLQKVTLKSCFEADQSNETNDVHHDFEMERVLFSYRKLSSVGLILTDEFE